MPLLSRDELKNGYESLKDNYEGYIQLSNKRIEHIFKTPTNLPSWSDIENSGGFIFEMVLYSPKEKKSILIRQVNSSWSWIEKSGIDWESTKEEDRDIFYSVFNKNRQELRMVQVWEKREDSISEDFSSLEFVGSFFAGFEKEDNK
jgi:CRISPR type III-associated protein (TIGR04423 family)